MEENDVIVCPACGKNMREILVRGLDTKIDICVDGCGGIYFDNREYKKFSDLKKDVGEAVRLVEGKTFEPAPDGQRNCPVCGFKMTKHFASPKHKITIDDCYNCGGIFLDHGELTQIRNEYDSKEESLEELKELLNAQFGAELAKAHMESVNARRIDTMGEFFAAYLNKRR